MRSVRLIIAVLLAASLAILPMSAAMAMTHAAKAEMSMGASGDNCPCCNAARKCATDTCQFKCFSAPAILEGAPLAQPRPELFIAIGEATLSPFLARPDPPPPRS